MVSFCCGFQRRPSRKGLASAWLLLGPLCTLSTPSGEISCSSSLTLHFYLSNWSHAFFLSSHQCWLRLSNSKLFAKNGSRLLRSTLPSLRPVPGGFLQMRPQHFSVRNLIPDNTSVMQICSWQVLFALIYLVDLTGSCVPSYQYSFNSFHQNIHI